MSTIQEKFLIDCECANILFAFLLKTRHESLLAKGHRGGLSEFDADKSMRLASKLWNDYFYLSRLTKFRFPVEKDRNDKHGHRVAYNVTPVLDAIRSAEGYGAKLLRFETEKNFGEMNIKEIYPEVTSSDLLYISRMGAVSDTDVRLLEGIGLLAGELKENELIAVGRHENPKATRDSLLYELDRWHEWTADLLDRLISGDSRDQERLCWQCWSFARECKLKAYGDEGFYELGLGKLLRKARELTNAHYVSALNTVQMPTAVVWQDSSVTSLRFPVAFVVSLSDYVAGTVRNYGENAKTFTRPMITIRDAEKASDKLGFFVQSPVPSRPLDFQETTIIPARSGVVMHPRRVLSGEIDLVSFGTESRRILDHLHKEYLLPDIMKQRVGSV